MRLRFALLAVAIACSGCAGNRILGREDKVFLADANAETLYQEQRYGRTCAKKSPACSSWQQEIRDSKTLIGEAETVLAMGHLPSQERDEIAAKLAGMRKH